MKIAIEVAPCRQLVGISPWSQAKNQLNAGGSHRLSQRAATPQFPYNTSQKGQRKPLCMPSSIWPDVDVSIEHRLVTNTQTDRQTRGHMYGRWTSGSGWESTFAARCLLHGEFDQRPWLCGKKPQEVNLKMTKYDKILLVLRQILRQLNWRKQQCQHSTTH